MEFTVSVGNIDPSSSDPCRPVSQDDRHRVQLAASRIGSTTVIAGRGEVDACNTHDVAAYVVSHLDECNHLVLDFSEVEFFGIQGFSMLHHVNVECAQRGISWSLIPSAEVWRVLRLCDPDGELPVTHATTVDLQEPGPRRHLRLL
ncbi:MAG TPA: STAS domain-containing protein [Mycobacterium sp.]